MERLVHGDLSALDPLVERYNRRVYRIALSYLRDPDDALDAVQDVFVKLSQNAAAWQPADSLAPWLARLTVNHAIDRYRRRRRRGALFAPIVESEDGRAREFPSPDPGPQDVAFGGELGAHITTALAALSDRQRAVFVLRHQEELSLKEIADTLGLALGTVKSTLHRALERLRLELEGVRP